MDNYSKRIFFDYFPENLERFKNQLLNISNHFDDFIFLNSNSNVSNCDYQIVCAFQSSEKFEGNSINNLVEFYEESKDFIFGNISYDLKDELFGLNSSKKPKVDFGKISFFVPKYLVFIKDGAVEIGVKNESDFKKFQELLLQSTNKNDQKIQEEHFSPNKAIYLEKFEQVKNHIRLGNIYEMNLCVEFSGRKKLDMVNLYKNLNEISKASYSGLYKQSENWLACSSPELYLQKTGPTIITKPIKGTIKRGENEIEDAKLKHELLNSEKERNENVMIVDLARNDLSIIAEKASVRVSKLFNIESFLQVHQMVSTIECKLKEDLHPIKAIENTFPMASMTGVPKKRALEIIENIEGFNRGLYSGSIGFFKPNGDFVFNVVIRSILYHQSSFKYTFSVGSAITDKCDAEQEFEECMLKAKALKLVIQN